jgi:hypothetical protein
LIHVIFVGAGLAFNARMRSVEELISLFDEAEAAAEDYERRYDRYGVASYAFNARQLRMVSRQWLCEAIEEHRQALLDLPLV